MLLPSLDCGHCSDQGHRMAHGLALRFDWDLGSGLSCGHHDGKSYASFLGSSQSLQSVPSSSALHLQQILAAQKAFHSP